MQFSNRKVLILMFSLLLSGCVANNKISGAEFKIQQTLLLQAKNYDGLIELYRKKLKVNDNAGDRYKLALYYYEAGDYRSSMYYLAPMSEKNNNEVDVLFVKNMIAIGDYHQAIALTGRMIKKHPGNAEAYNLQGVARALSGSPAKAKESLQQARDLFISDEIVVNNLAMISIIQQRYGEAVSLLLPQYLRGKKSTKLLHNLVFALVKSGDADYAANIIESEKLSDHPQELIESLKLISPLKNENVQ